jgi:3-deoxy-D-manno-octulosonic-acid transferase
MVSPYKGSHDRLEADASAECNIVGTVCETVTKVLQELQDRNVVVIENKRIIVTNLEKLKQY